MTTSLLQQATEPRTTKSTTLNRVVDFLVLYLLIAVSGIPFFEWHKEFVIIGTLLSGAVFFTRGHSIHVAIIYALVLCYFVELFQALMFNNLVYSSLLNTACKLLQAYFTIHILGHRFFTLFVQFMYVSCLLSLPFFVGGYVPGFTDYVITQFSPYFGPIFPIDESIDFYVRSANIIIYTFNHNVIYDEIRNSGPFWEPGGFAIFINLALSFSIARQNRLVSVRNMVLMATLLTTFSTGGYVAFFLIIIGYIISSEHVNHKPFILLVSLVAAPVLYTTLSFLGDKIQTNLVTYDSDTTSRFGSAYIDLLNFFRSPLIGFGRRFENIYGPVAYDIRMHRNVGITTLLVHYGIVVFSLYMFYLVQCFRRLNQLTGQPFWYGVFAFLSLLSSCFSQKVCEYPFFIGLVFIGACFYHSVSPRPAVNSPQHPSVNL